MHLELLYCNMGLFLFTVDLVNIVMKHGVNVHASVDDIQ